MFETKRPFNSVKKVLVLGSGGIQISQAGEFDYSGSQAIKSLKEEGIEVILVNPNIATIQTDLKLADRVYFEPLGVNYITQVIEKEKPDSILLSFGGQTALNLGLALDEQGILKSHNVKVLGSSIQTIREAEDRGLFKAKLDKIGIKTPKSFVAYTAEDALTLSKDIGFPLMMRFGFSLGGLGSGIIKTATCLKERVNEVLNITSHVLIEECLLGWNEFEYEILRDVAGNVITICNMENVDPMGIHTGESIVVAPSQSLNNEEYHRLRNIAIKVANSFNILGEFNIQYTFNLQTSDYRVIEINPRLSRSSALASKVTGYPLAFVAVKLLLGYKLHELQNRVTGKTCAFFEPALDYIAVKIPRWDIHKFKHAERSIGTEMKSIGEVMAIGRSFPEALQKAVGMLNIGAEDLSDYQDHIPCLEHEIEHATDRRLFALYRFFLKGGSVEKAYRLSGIDKWFLNSIKIISCMELDCKIKSTVLTKNSLYDMKKFGFSDKSIAKFFDMNVQDLRLLRIKYEITPKVKQIDTVAGEFVTETNYLYMTYHCLDHDISPSSVPATLIIGSGPYSIGSSVEFDWCAVTTARTLRALSEVSIMVNSNPETVSTDYDESDRLYFEQLSFERIQDILDFENLKGIIVSVGGQVANNLSLPLFKLGHNILGTSPQDINRAENRAIFSKMLNDLQIDQPAWQAVTTLKSAKNFAKAVGYPILVRPSYVLSGSAMNIVYSEEALEELLLKATNFSPLYPIVISDFITNAKELEIDGVSNKGDIVIYAIFEHIENAGVHSGDATIVLPPQNLYLETVRRAKNITKKIVKALKVSGPFNIQFIAKDNNLKVIECNIRSSRSFPFVSKITNYNFIQIATEVIMGNYKQRRYNTLDLDYVGVKAPLFSYNRLKGANPVAHVEMSSTGEVGCIGYDLVDAFYKAWQATGMFIVRKRIFFSISPNKISKMFPEIKYLYNLHWKMYATPGTHKYLKKVGIESVCVHKDFNHHSPHGVNIRDVIINREVDLIVNVPNEHVVSISNVSSGFKLRRLAVDHHIPLITNFQISKLALRSLITLHDHPIEVRALDEFITGN